MPCRRRRLVVCMGVNKKEKRNKKKRKDGKTQRKQDGENGKRGNCMVVKGEMDEAKSKLCLIE